MGLGRYLFIAPLLFAFAAGAVQAQDEGCQRINWEGGSIEQGCEGTTGDKENESWWTGPVAQTIYALVGLAGTSGAFLLGLNRVRRRRRTLRALLADAENAFITCKDEPLAGIERLAGIRAELAVRHENGHVADSHFLALDKKIADYVAKLRMIEIERLFPRLPMDLLREIRTLLEDGHLSKQDAVRIENHAISLKVAAATRRALTKHLESWVTSDANKAPSPAPTMVAAAR